MAGLEQRGTRARPVEVAAAARAGAWGDSHVIPVDGRDVRLFFLCGHPKSGTNWVGALLNLHPAIVCRGEFRFEALRHAFDALERHWWHVASETPVKAEAERCFRETVARLMIAAMRVHNPSASWVGDRTPRALAAYIPGAPQVYVLRDPRDVLVSWTFQELREGGPNIGAGPLAATTVPLREAFAANPAAFREHPERLLSSEGWVRFATRRYARHVAGDLEFIGRARAGEIDAPLHLVRYERLHADFDAERAALYQFLGLDPAEAAAPSGATRTLPGFETEDPTSFFRKGEPGDWRRYFTDDAKRWFKAEAGELPARLEYETGTDW
jgi:hypothetical protein